MGPFQETGNDNGAQVQSAKMTPKTRLRPSVFHIREETGPVWFNNGTPYYSHTIP